MFADQNMKIAASKNSIGCPGCLPGERWNWFGVIGHHGFAFLPE
jgi:hypothetical protein